MNTFTAVIHREGEIFVAQCPEFGTVSQGKTEKKALSNLKEATALYLEEFPSSTSARSVIKTFKLAHV
jgi:predicted RNase H-like HicB family nuclease